MHWLPVRVLGPSAVKHSSPYVLLLPHGTCLTIPFNADKFKYHLPGIVGGSFNIFLLEEGVGKDTNWVEESYLPSGYGCTLVNVGCADCILCADWPGTQDPHKSLGYSHPQTNEGVAMYVSWGCGCVCVLVIAMRNTRTEVLMAAATHKLSTISIPCWWRC